MYYVYMYMYIYICIYYVQLHVNKAYTILIDTSASNRKACVLVFMFPTK